MTDEAHSMGEGWMPINTAPDLDRVWVAGWQKPSGFTSGYWWYHEDVVSEGVAIEHSEATLWFPIKLPAFPSSPVARARNGVALQSDSDGGEVGNDRA